jgi:hypothetical protein
MTGGAGCLCDAGWGTAGASRHIPARTGCGGSLTWMLATSPCVSPNRCGGHWSESAFNRDLSGSRVAIHLDVGFLFGRIRGERAVPKERTRERNKDSQRRKEQPGLDNRHRDSDRQIREKRGDTRIDSLRQIYGDGFAPGIRGDAHLRTLLERTGSDSLSDYLKTAAESSVGPQDRVERVNEKSSGIQYASDARFREYLFQGGRRSQVSYSARRRNRLACNALVFRWATFLSDSRTDRHDSPGPD